MIGERIKEVRKALNMTQQVFASKIGLKQNSVAVIEMGKNAASDQTIFAICREFRVSEDWLRHGFGEMFIPSPSSTVEKLCEEYDLDDAARIVLEKFIELDPEEQKVIIGYMCNVVDAIRAKEPTAEDYHAMLDEQIAKEKTAAAKSEA